MTTSPSTPPAAAEAAATGESSAVQAFSAWLFQQRQGALHAELTVALAELTQAVMDTDKEGTLTLTVKVKKAGRGIQMIVSDDVKLNKPRPTVDPSFFFFDEDTGGLTRNDPYQPDLPLQTIPQRRSLSELREVG